MSVGRRQTESFPSELGLRVKIVVDHLAGHRRGERQEFPFGERISIGRHPRCQVSFDAHRDLDASSRHAELRCDGESLVLKDVGSSNGTFVAGSRVSELALVPQQEIEVAFGPSGPRLRIWYGPVDAAPEPVARARSPRRSGALGLAAAALVAGLGALWFWLAR